MRKGDLSGTSVATLLSELAAESATGCLRIIGGMGEEAAVYLVDGRIQAAVVPGARAQLGSRLLSCGALSPEALAEALEAQRTELQGWRLGELLIHLGYVAPTVVESFVLEQLREAVWDLLRWTEGRWRFRDGERTRDDVSNPLAVGELLGELRSRQAGWAEISSVIDGPTAVPRLSGREAASAGVGLSPDAWSLICKIDGERSIAELARECGYTHFEVCQVLLPLVSAGIVDITSRRGQPGPAQDAPEGPGTAPGAQPTGDYAAALDRVSLVLSEVLGPAEAAGSDPYELPASLRAPAPKAAEAAPPDDSRAAKHRAAAAAELAAAQREAEELRAAGSAPEPVGLQLLRRRSSTTGRGVPRPRKAGGRTEPPQEYAAADTTADAPADAVLDASDPDAFTARPGSGGRHAFPPWEPTEAASPAAALPEGPDDVVDAAAPIEPAEVSSPTDAPEIAEQLATGPSDTVAVLAEFSAALAAATEPEPAVAADADATPAPVALEPGTEPATPQLPETADVDAGLWAGEQLAPVEAADQYAAVGAVEPLTAFGAEPLAAVATTEMTAPPTPDAADAPEAAEADGADPQLEPLDMADTAALLRELSSLGFDEEAQRPPTRPAPPPRPGAPNTDRRNRRRGFFSR